MLSGYGLYKIYAPIKLHFTTSYDAIKYHNVAKSISKDVFLNRKDAAKFGYLGAKIQTPRDALELCVFNFVYQNENWFYEDVDIAHKIWLNKHGFYAALQHNLKADFGVISETMKTKSLTFSQLINKTVSGNVAPLLQMCMKNIISKEFICFLDKDILVKWEKEYDQDPMLSKEVSNLTKYQPFAILIKRGIVG